MESLADDSAFVELVMAIKEEGREAVAVVNPGTPLDRVTEHLVVLDGVMCMGVDPGFSGQVFKDEVLDTIRAFRKRSPHLPIAVDGGVNADTAPRILASGATRLCVASYLWQSSNLTDAIESLKATVLEGMPPTTFL